MREHLLGYVLGALEPAEQQLVERRLEADPELRRQLRVLEVRIGKLKSLEETHEPPVGLASRTCEWVTAQTANQTFPSQISLGDSRRADSPHQVSLAPVNDPPMGRRWSVADLLVAACILLSAGILLVPLLAKSRYDARVTQCQNNLRSVGTSLVSYANLTNGRFPQIPAKGKLSFAGLYAPLLREKGLLEDENWLACPATEMARRREWHSASMSELENATGAALTEMIEFVGGNYAYNLGYFEDDEYVAPLNQSRHEFAILADAPCPVSKVKQSKHHGRCGQNVLFEDMAVRYIVGCTLAQLGDDIFQNRDGLVAAGLDSTDASLGSSATPPLLDR